MDGTSTEAVVGTSAGAVCRRLDALAGWPRRLWARGTAAAVLVGLGLGAAGHLLAGTTWVALAVTAWGIRSVVAAQRTEVGASWITLRGLTGSRTIGAAEVRCVDVAHTEMAAPRLVVHGSGALGIAIPLAAVASDPELGEAVRRFLAGVPAGTPVDPEVVDALGHRITG